MKKNHLILLDVIMKFRYNTYERIPTHEMSAFSHLGIHALWMYEGHTRPNNWGDRRKARKLCKKVPMEIESDSIKLQYRIVKDSASRQKLYVGC